MYDDQSARVEGDGRVLNSNCDHSCAVMGSKNVDRLLMAAVYLSMISGTQVGLH
jgi:hypothetical protein